MMVTFMIEPKKLYELNEKIIKIRFSREYLVGSRVLLYLNMLRHARIRHLIIRLNKDRKTLKIRKKYDKSSQKVLSIDFCRPVVGKRLAVYTSIYGKYDKLCEPLYVDPNCDYYILTDQYIPEDSIWKKIDFEFPEYINTNFLKNRYVKMFPNLVFPDYSYSLYIDGNITVVSEVSLYLNDFNCRSGIAMHKHPASSDLYDEIEACLMTEKITNDEASYLRKRLQDEGFPKNFGMLECNIILREHNKDACKLIMSTWWDELLHGLKRDQLYFTYSLYKNGYKYSDIDILGLNMNMNPMFIRETHL